LKYKKNNANQLFNAQIVIVIPRKNNPYYPDYPKGEPSEGLKEHITLAEGITPENSLKAALL
jgi:hypothetical protein